MLRKPAFIRHTKVTQC